MTIFEVELKNDIGIKVLNGLFLSERDIKNIIKYELFEREEIYDIALSLLPEDKWFKCFALLKVKEKYFKIYYLKQMVSKEQTNYILSSQVAEPVKESNISGEYVKI